MMPSRPSISLSIVAAALGCVFLYLARDRGAMELGEVTRRSETESELKQKVIDLTSELERIRQEKTALEGRLQQTLPALPSSSPEPIAAVKEGLPSDVDRRSANFWAKNRLRGVEQFLAFTPGERESLLTALEQEYSREGRDLTRVLESQLGPSRFEEYQNLRNEKERAEEREALEGELFTLSRKLSLTPEQEVIVEGELRAVHEELAPLRRRFREESEDALALHSAPGDNRASLQEAYAQLSQIAREEEIKKRELLVARLREKLTDDQINSLLALQVGEGGSFFQSEGGEQESGR